MRTIEFSGFQLDLDLLTLRKENESIPIGKRCFDLLVHLIENRERYVSTESLRKEVWKGAKLSAAAIPTCVRELRILLEDDASRPRFVDSKKGKGYRFIAHPVFSSLRTTTLAVGFNDLPLVGRTREIRTLRESHRSAASAQQCHLIIIRGEAGIGKSRLLDDFLQGFTPSAHRLIAKCRESKSQAQFGAWIEILEQARASSTFENIEPHISEARARSLSQESLDPSEETQKRQRALVFNKWIEAIQELLRRGPLIIAFDDIHLADPDSIHLTAWAREVLHDCPLTIIATHRPFSRSRSIEVGLEDLTIAANAVIDTPPLSKHDIDEILRPHFLHESFSPDQLHTLTGGNPLLIGHAIRNAELERIDPRVREDDRVGDSLHNDLVARIMSDLPIETRELLTIGSVIGETFSTPMLSTLTDLPAPEIQARLEPARQARLLRENELVYQFSHAILREALYAAIPTSKKSHLHLKAAHFLQSRSDATLHLCEIASHLRAAVPNIATHDAISYCILASDYSVNQCAYFDAKQFAESAFNLSTQDPCITLHHRCRLQITLARRCRLLGDRASARQALLAVADIARRDSMHELLIECALSLTEDFALIDFGVHDILIENLLREALQVTSHDQVALRAKLLARLSQTLQWSHQSEQQKVLARQAHTLAVECSDFDAQREALCALSEALHGPATAPERLQVLEELDGLPGNWARADDALLHQTRKITALLDLGQTDRIASENITYWELASRTGQPHHIWYAMTTDSMRSLMQGDLELSERLEANFRTISEISENPNVTQGFAAQRFFWEVECGRSREIFSALKEVCKRYPLVVGWEAALSWLHWDLNEPGDARRYMSHFTDERLGTLRRQPGSGASIAMLCEVAARLGKKSLQTSLFSFIEPLKHRCASAGYGVLYYGSYARYGGLLAGALGDRKKALELLSLAADQEASRGADLWLAYTLLDLASAVRRWGRPSGRAAEIFDEASAIAKALRAPRLLRRLGQIENEIS